MSFEVISRQLVVVCIFLSAPVLSTQNQSKSLSLIFVTFRHGDRTPDYPSYPNDPHQSKYGIGEGQLTNMGKRREYELGLTLKHNYGSFLGDIYYDGLLYARSTIFERAMTSLQLVLTGLFPPKRENIWSKSDDLAMQWQPIPTKHKAKHNDPELLGVYCESFGKTYSKFKNTTQFQQIFMKYGETFQYIQKKTGLASFELLDIHKLYLLLRTEKLNGLKLPSWTKSVYPAILEELFLENYNMLTATPDLRKYTGGFHMKEIINQIKLKQQNKLPLGRKLYLYSGHEVSIVYLMRIMDIYYPHIPNYGACLVLECYETPSKDYYVKVLYKNDGTGNFTVMPLPGCDEECPLNTFIKIVNSSLPVSTDNCRIIK